MPYTSPATVVTATTITSAWGNSVKAATDFLANPPACRVYNSGAVAVNDSVVTYLTFNSERYDTNSMHDTITNSGRITINTAGLYIVGCNIGFAAAADYDSGMAILRVNGATFIAESFTVVKDANDNFYIPLTTVYKFSVADYIEVGVWQNNTANVARNVVVSGNRSPEFFATWVGLG